MSSLQPSRFLERIIRFLMPFFSDTAEDTEEARADIIQTLESYGTRNRAELLNAAQIIAYSFSTLDALAEANPRNSPPPCAYATEAAPTA